MTEKIVNFIKYNNAFTIIVLACFLGFGVTFAASSDLREGIYASKDTIVAVDNSRIVSVDLSSFNFNLKINSVTEDEKNYYVTYSYQTLMVTEGVWQEKVLEKNLTINKESLMGKDFGLYLAKELGDRMNYELSYLEKVQKLEREKGESKKVVSTEYSGLIGKMLDPKEMVIEGYKPVIPEPAPEVPAEAVPAPEEIIVSVQHPENRTTVIGNQDSPVSTVASSSSSGTEEVVDPGLVQTVVGELLQNQSSSTPSDVAPLDPVIAPDNTSSTESVSDPATTVQ